MSEDIWGRLSRSPKLPTPPRVALEVLRLAGSEKASVGEIATLIEKDAALTGRLLKTVNRAYYGVRRQIASVRQAAVRELAEETGLRAVEADLEAMGVLTFLFPSKPEWDHRVHVFLTRNWQGTPVDSAEITPIWFPLHQPPYQRMWNDAASWLPLVLDGQHVKATFIYNKDNETFGEVRMQPQPDR